MCEIGRLVRDDPAFQCTMCVGQVMGNPYVFLAKRTACAWATPNLPALAWLPVPCTLGHRRANAKELNSLLFIVFSYVSRKCVNLATLGQRVVQFPHFSAISLTNPNLIARLQSVPVIHKVGTGNRARKNPS